MGKGLRQGFSAASVPGGSVGSRISHSSGEASEGGGDGIARRLASLLRPSGDLGLTRRVGSWTSLHSEGSVPSVPHSPSARASPPPRPGSTGHMACEEPTAHASLVPRPHSSGEVLEYRSRSSDAAEAALLAPMRDPPLPGGKYPVHTSRMAVDSYQGCTFVNQYVVVKALGQGSHSRVKLALRTSDQRLYALKLIRRQRPRPQLPHLLGAAGGETGDGGPSQEARIMARLAHPNIVRLVEVIEDPAGRKALLALEFVAGGPVLAAGARLPEAVAREFCRDVLQEASREGSGS
ncbi:hypothetical protein WJX81_002136 [Elliptochloris bilobata]|uniref:Protein kinase domain-containing protein n=1 Tax=Elliptochloris bilobata TaxID=381761 RepID=A0AAW1SJU2_9CHLO